MNLNPSQFCSCNQLHHGGMTGQLGESEQQTTIKKKNHHHIKSLGLFRLGMPPGMQHKKKPLELASSLRLESHQPCSQDVCAHSTIHHPAPRYTQGQGGIWGTEPGKIWSTLFDLGLLDEKAAAQTPMYFELDALQLIRPAKYSGNSEHWAG